MAEQGLKAVVGLGNPGEKYSKTRHNAGFWLIDELVRRHAGDVRAQARLHGVYGQIGIAGHKLHLLAPTTFMNVSGRAVRALLDFYKLEPGEILVAHDELDLPAGTARLKRGGGPGGHNGLKDIIRCIGPEFARLRIGIGHPGARDQVLGYVLSSPGRDEAIELDHAITAACDAVENCIGRGWDAAVQQLHSR